MAINDVSISQAEWQVMKILWEDAPRTLPQIMDALSYTQWSKTTIQTYLSRLVKKGALKTERHGKGYLYSPTITELESQLSESKSFLDKVYDGSVASMLSGFVKTGNLSQEELNKLKKLLAEQENRDADS